jgi:arsenate reductase (thioredoxin)
VADDRYHAHPDNLLESRMPGKRYKVLFICRDNAVHSIMAEALLKRWGGADFSAFSAGIKPADAIDSCTVELLKERRIWQRGLRARSHQEFFERDAPRMDFIISLGECPSERMPKEWPGNPQIFHWRITSPDWAGTPTEAAFALVKALIELETRVRLFVLVYKKEKTKRTAA